MFNELMTHLTDYFSSHVILANAIHFAGGFGLAIILQHYLKGKEFLPVQVGWILIAISVTVHLMALMS
ncbi:MAG: hypothetical protein BWY54_00282 [Candidatus Dependentiae bacterium ADurb.Bin331]|nr:MAG: hypothetical protein BWY54_00282 [Candidatus Dependentiae bacterium ADurb.Bin331]